MQKTSRRQSVAALSAKKLMLHTSLLTFYLEIGLHITHIYQIVKYTGSRVFKPFADMIMGLRREASEDPEKTPLAQMLAIQGNN